MSKSGAVMVKSRNAATTGQILGKAHKLCQWLRARTPHLYSQEHAIPMAWAVEDSTKWHIGSVDDLPNSSDESAFRYPMRLPTRLLLIEGDTTVLMADGRLEPGTLFGLLRDDCDGAIDCFFFLKVVDFSFCGACGLTTDEDGDPVVGFFGDGRRRIDRLDNLRPLIHVVQRFLLALHCTNVRGVDNAPPVAINKKRKKSGKPPLFTYKTLHVLSGERGGVHDRRDAGEEARQSPRLHFRRGHVRRLDDGRMTWVQQCMVGNRRLGIVEKAYALNNVAMAAR